MDDKTRDYAKGGTELENPIGPQIGSKGIGWCTSLCPHHTGSHCCLTGFPPEGICEPWAERLVRRCIRLDGMVANLGLVSMIERYYETRGYRWPSAQEAILWTITELGEVCELLLARTVEWVRNNPDDKEKYSPERVEEELADAVMMLLVAGIVSDGAPLIALRRKMQKWLSKEQ